MTKLLALATAALKPGQLGDQQSKYFPRVDYIEIQRHIGMDVLDYDVYHKKPFGDFFRRLDTQVRSDLYLTWQGFRKRNNHRLVFAWSERAGIPYAGFRRLFGDQRPFAAMFTCWSDRQKKVIAGLNLFSAMDTIAVHCHSMQQLFTGLGVPESKIHLIPYSVDHRFFTPQKDTDQDSELVLSLGEIRSRDYATLFKAIDGLPIKLLVAAAGAWYARQKEKNLAYRVPENVNISDGFSLADLKNLYARSRFVVLPLYDEVYSAGATASLEAMCMGRAVVAFRSRGIQDYIVDGETGILVEPGNANAMRAAIEFLIANPSEAERLGRNGRQKVDEYLNLDRYVHDVANWLQTCLEP
jgi:glycosyltransferase involved in cell wall biosynthesis